MSSPRLYFRTEEWARADQPTSPFPEIWGGVECTVNRVGDTYHDQLERSGHKDRLNDLNQIAELGIRAFRYPILWEHHANEPVNWSWAEERMGRLRELKMDPIVGLVHHGSGPPDTDLLNPGFPKGLAAHAERVARR